MRLSQLANLRKTAAFPGGRGTTKTSLVFNNEPESLASGMRQDKEVEVSRLEEKSTLSLFSDDTVICVENLVATQGDYQNDACVWQSGRYKTNARTSVPFLRSSSRSQIEILKMPHTVALKV